MEDDENENGIDMINEEQKIHKAISNEFIQNNDNNEIKNDKNGSQNLLNDKK